MKRVISLVIVVLFGVAIRAASKLPPGPDEQFGSLFVTVQEAKVFPDQKTFPDCVARGPPAAIL